jgi:hypothetical protein
MQRYYVQAQMEELNNFFASKLPLGGRPGLDRRIARGTSTPRRNNGNEAE